MKPQVLPNDVPQVLTALRLDAIFVEPWLATLTTDDLKCLSDITARSAKSGNNDSYISQYADFIVEMKHLKDLATRVKTVQGYVRGVFKSAYLAYVADEGKATWKAAVDRAIGRKEAEAQMQT